MLSKVHKLSHFSGLNLSADFLVKAHQSRSRYSGIPRKKFFTALRVSPYSNVSRQDKHPSHGHHGAKETISDSYGERYATNLVPKYHLASKVSYR